jgi:hypothetical protein
MVLVDLDREYECAPAMVGDWLPAPSALMTFRIAVRSLEAWLLADRERVARFLRIPVSRVPLDPEAAANPKRLLVDLARGSTNRAIVRDIVPNIGSGRAVGPGYTGAVVEFASRWQPDVAAERAPALARALARLRALA